MRTPKKGDVGIDANWLAAVERQRWGNVAAFGDGASVSKTPTSLNIVVDKPDQPGFWTKIRSESMDQPGFYQHTQQVAADDITPGTIFQDADPGIASYMANGELVYPLVEVNGVTSIIQNQQPLYVWCRPGQNVDGKKVFFFDYSKSKQSTVPAHVYFTLDKDRVRYSPSIVAVYISQHPTNSNIPWATDSSGNKLEPNHRCTPGEHFLVTDQFIRWPYAITGAVGEAVENNDVSVGVDPTYDVVECQQMGLRALAEIDDQAGQSGGDTNGTGMLGDQGYVTLKNFRITTFSPFNLTPKKLNAQSVLAPPTQAINSYSLQGAVNQTVLLEWNESFTDWEIVNVVRHNIWTIQDFYVKSDGTKLEKRAVRAAIQYNDVPALVTAYSDTGSSTSFTDKPTGLNLDDCSTQ